MTSIKKPYLIAEIGINHNGDLNIAKELINISKDTGFHAVKFQKRDIYIVYSNEQLETPRESPWGKTQREQKQGLEFNESDYREIDSYAKELDIIWFASAWDLKSQLFLRKFSWCLSLKFQFIGLICQEMKRNMSMNV